jgi:hypothetical protein
MFEAIMITILPANESAAPPTEWMETLPKDTKWFVVLGGEQIRSVLEKIEIDGQTYFVERILNPHIQNGIYQSLLRGTVGIPKR